MAINHHQQAKQNQIFMSKQYYLPDADPARLAWSNTFGQKLPGHATALGLAPGDVSSVVNDVAFFAWLMAMNAIFTSESENWTSYKNLLRNGPIGSPAGQTPAVTNLPAMPQLVAPGIFPRIMQLVRTIKSKPGYTDAIGRDLGIVGAEQIVDTDNMKPVVKLNFSADHVHLKWAKDDSNSIRIEADHGTGFQLLAISTSAHYVDTTVPTAAATWKYRAMFMMHDELTGQWSDVVSINVG